MRPNEAKDLYNCLESSCKTRTTNESWDNKTLVLYRNAVAKKCGLDSDVKLFASDECVGLKAKALDAILKNKFSTEMGTAWMECVEREC